MVVEAATIVMIVTGVAIVAGTSYAIYDSTRQTKEFKRQRELSADWRKEDAEFMADQANMSLVIAVIGIIISVVSVFLMMRGQKNG